MAEYHAMGAVQPVPIVAPTPVTNLRATAIGSLSVALAWSPPSRGTQPIRYTVLMRPTGAGWWSIAAETTATTAKISHLSPKTKYDFEIMADNT